ncbi:hypothetical protein A2125_00420 [Candidatus Woesebacteria bacterium GWB1_43_5]|uniref:Nucleotidyl transferase AbiEii/AbiGii toxin family protein n=1 Tax=Candidatus Woesebacteria bacterium GWB1_43_5 TaxID=1802474 RepID=A0A1F7WU67_9BACT|nr:MAG: hypothetical protein A2125_00420 [Candidatus Woesebacteria bacterium GWB1_43_5]
MIKIDLHKSIFIGILREIYNDPALRTVLGFKGGTAAHLFYELPRFSVDLDFDLLDSGRREEVFKRVKEILSKFGTLVEAQEKKSTLFYLLSYEKGERGLKVEISKRLSKSQFLVKNYLGVSMLVMREEDVAAGKLSALITRRKFASRDLFDLWFFLKNNWQINEEVVNEKTGMSMPEALEKAEGKVMAVKKTELLAGLGDLLDNKQKAWVKEKLQEELLFLLRLYRSNL